MRAAVLAIIGVVMVLSALVVLSRMLPSLRGDSRQAARAPTNDMVAEIALLQKELGQFKQEKEQLLEQVKDQDKSMFESKFIRRANLDASPVCQVPDTPRSSRSQVRLNSNF